MQVQKLENLQESLEWILIKLKVVSEKEELLKRNLDRDGYLVVGDTWYL